MSLYIIGQQPKQCDICGQENVNASVGQYHNPQKLVSTVYKKHRNHLTHRAKLALWIPADSLFEQMSVSQSLCNNKLMNKLFVIHFDFFLLFIIVFDITVKFQHLYWPTFQSFFLYHFLIMRRMGDKQQSQTQHRVIIIWYHLSCRHMIQCKSASLDENEILYVPD